jgi:diguanylate cyclase (GGDEF)-like protein
MQARQLKAHTPAPHRRAADRAAFPLQSVAVTAAPTDIATPATRPITQSPGWETARLKALGRIAILDSGPEASFDRVTGLACRLFGVPHALISLVDSHRLWFKSHAGWPQGEAGRDGSFCAHAILRDDVMVVPDASLDPHFFRHPWVAGAPGIRFYAGQPLSATSGEHIGTLCVMDCVPRRFDAQNRADLAALAKIVERELHIRELAEAHMGLMDELDSARKECMVDPALETLNRSALSRILPGERQRARREGSCLMLALIDLNHVRTLDATMGMPMAEHLLCAVAERMRRALRPYDLLGRWAGHEFMLVCPNVDPSAAAIIVERVRREIVAPYQAADGSELCINVNIGAVVCDFSSADIAEAGLIDVAREALVEARLSGRSNTRVRALT